MLFMRKYLLPEQGNFYKANLHAHSTFSDGKNTPEEMRDYYKSFGYQILSLTDHDVLIDHSHLNQEDFLMLTGYEYGIVEDDPNYATTSRTVEFNIYPRDPHNIKQVCFDPSVLIFAKEEVKNNIQYIGEKVKHEFTAEFFQKVIDAAKANDCLVGINHPVYSFLDTETVFNMKGLDFLEIVNQGSCISGEDDNHYMYDQLLRKGYRMAITASDDRHRTEIIDFPNDPRPWTSTMIKAKSLSHGDIYEAMEKGDMYTTQGPEIYELYIENDEVHMKFSNAKHVMMVTSGRRRKFTIAKENEYLNEVVYPIPKEMEWIRMVVIDKYGRKARTRAYFL